MTTNKFLDTNDCTLVGVNVQQATLLASLFCLTCFTYINCFACFVCLPACLA